MLTSLAAFLVLLASGPVRAESANPPARAESSSPFEMTTYKVKKGDTLWSIAEKELKQPFQWPVLWMENPVIKNPDRLYPGQTINIPLSLRKSPEAAGKAPAGQQAALPPVLEEEEVQVSGPRELEVTRKYYITTRNEMLWAGYITKSHSTIGVISGSLRGNSYFAHMDEVFVKSDFALKPGAKFYITKKGHDVVHPATGEKLGYMMHTIGLLQIIKEAGDESTAVILEAFEAINTGDTFETYVHVEPPYIVEAPRKPDVEGYVISSRNQRSLGALFDIIHIDRGSEDDLRIGDILAILTPGRRTMVQGLIQVISTRETTASAMIIYSELEISPGYKVKGLDSRDLTHSIPGFEMP